MGRYNSRDIFKLRLHDIFGPIKSVKMHNKNIFVLSKDRFLHIYNG